MPNDFKRRLCEEQGVHIKTNSALLKLVNENSHIVRL